MNKFIVIVLCSFFTNGALAQDEPQRTSKISDTVQISYLYNVTILFDSPLQGEPFFGSPILLTWEKLDAHTVLIKANGEKMQELGTSTIPNTNMTVKTQKALYNFLLTYEKEPDRIYISPQEYLPSHIYPKMEEIQPKEKESSNEIDTLVARLKGLYHANRNLSGIGIQHNKFKMLMEVTNIWADTEYLYFKVSVKNLSGISYDIDYWQFVTSYGKLNLKQSSDNIEDKKAVTSLNPMQHKIKPGETHENIFVFEKFSLDKKQEFNLVLGEINGARQITVPVERKTLLEAQVIDP